LGDGTVNGSKVLLNRRKDKNPLAITPWNVENDVKDYDFEKVF